MWLAMFRFSGRFKNLSPIATDDLRQNIWREVMNFLVGTICALFLFKLAKFLPMRILASRKGCIRHGKGVLGETFEGTLAHLLLVG